MIDVHDDGFDITVVHVLLLVCQFFEFLECPVDLELVEVESQFGDPVAECVPPTVFAEHQVRVLQTDVFRAHDFVGGCMLEHAVLVNTSLVGKSIRANNRLVSGNGHPGNPRHQPSRGVEA